MIGVRNHASQAASAPSSCLAAFFGPRRSGETNLFEDRSSWCPAASNGSAGDDSSGGWCHPVPGRRQPLGIGPGFIRTEFLTTGRGLLEHERGGGLG